MPFKRLICGSTSHSELQLRFKRVPTSLQPLQWLRELCNFISGGQGRRKLKRTVWIVPSIQPSREVRVLGDNWNWCGHGPSWDDIDGFSLPFLWARIGSVQLSAKPKGMKPSRIFTEIRPVKTVTSPYRRRKRVPVTGRLRVKYGYPTSAAKSTCRRCRDSAGSPLSPETSVPRIGNWENTSPANCRPVFNNDVAGGPSWELKSHRPSDQIRAVFASLSRFQPCKQH
ncbi:hypothetical protein B0H11DRAFT_2209943 [Mycena galericulata]|nr:hypothetical protein B0H11DRAFT_2209943 [Mycena galericulata]